tara:strand:- start:77519 stop:78475 length:957 start_codon:yes stop_codon:yes gene_type:complete
MGEIFDGYSVSTFEGRDVFVKHINIRDQKYIHSYYEKYKNIALSKGIESQEDREAYIKQEDLWEESDNMKILSLTEEIKNLKKTKESVFLPSQKSSFQKTIEKKSVELYDLRKSKAEIVGLTADSYASKRSNDEMLRFCVFKDPDFTENLHTEDEFSELEVRQVMLLSAIVTESSDKMCEDNIKHAVLRPFFGMYISNCENPSDFYGKPIVDLSAYQMKVAMYGKVFNSIFQYTQDIPDNIREDPDKLLAYSESQRNKDSNKGGIKDDSDASAVFGATNEDMKDLTKDAKTVSLSEAAKKAGGKLDMKQMMRLAGHDV